VLAALACLFSCVAAETRAQPISLPPEMLEDAELTDVFFLDPQRGWAVGDRGVIWLTQDGGRVWQLADSPVTCRLESVWFVDESHGWAAGGWMQPYSHASVAVVLRTDNGGRRWTRVPVDTLPKLLKIRFFDQRRGWAVGAPSAMYPSGAFGTTDGGRSWSALPTDRQDTWLAADFPDPSFGLLVGRDGAVSSASAQALQPLNRPAAGLRQLRAARVSRAAATSALWLAGDGGFAATSIDHGGTWRALSFPAPPQTMEQIDFRTIAIEGQTCWLTGNPGSCLFRSRDGGRTWQVLATGHRLPINAIAFLDEQQGWAVGPLGTILVTSDGGDSWARQRGGGTRVAVLGLFAEADDVPLELFTQLCGDEGYLGAVELLTRRDVETKTPAAEVCDHRAAAGIAAVGGAYLNRAWRFPLRQPGLELSGAAIVEGWNVANRGDGVRALEEAAVLRLRQWQPEIVVTQAADPTAAQPLSHVINQVVLSAVERAADPTFYPDQVHVLGLPPWRVKKVFAVARNPSSATVILETSRFSPQLGRSIRDHSVFSRGLIREEWSPPDEQIGFELLLSAVPRSQAGRDFFTGLSIRPGSDCRRRQGAPPPTPLASLGRQTQKQRAMELLLTRAADDERDATAWLAQIDDLTGDLSPMGGGEMLYQLAQHYREIGSLSLAADSLELLLDKYPGHPLAQVSLIWLTQYYSSREVTGAFKTFPEANAQRDETATVAAAFNAALPPGFDRKLELVQVDRTEIQRASLEQSPEGADAQRLTLLVNKLQPLLPACFSEPRLRAAKAAAARLRGEQSEAKREYQQIAASQPFGPWQQTARGEIWLESRRGHPPKPLRSCRRAEAKPLLDGQLDEPLWADASPAELTSQLADDADWPARVWLAYDDEHFYVAAQCRKAPGFEYIASPEPRRRDPDLRYEDRIELLLDIDRDYNTFFRLTIDHRGWPGEACWGDGRWNPDWFVAAAREEHWWTVEAAIPLEQLGLRHVASGEVWAVGIQRVIPTLGFQAWTHPASVAGQPEGFGYLSFD